MDMDPDFSQASPAVLMAAALHLLSCSAAHGVSVAKARALVRHLTTLAERPDTAPLLGRTCDELAAIWQRIGDELEQHRRTEHAQAAGCDQPAAPPVLH